MYITLKTTFTSTCYILTISVALDWEWRDIWIEGTYWEKSGKEIKKDRQWERKKDRKKGRKKERWDKTVAQSVFKYMYITLNTTFTSTCYHQRGSSWYVGLTHVSKWPLNAMCYDILSNNSAKTHCIAYLKAQTMFSWLVQAIKPSRRSKNAR